MIYERYKQLRIAQELNAPIIKKVSQAIMTMKDGVYIYPKKEEVYKYLNELARDKKVSHWRLVGKDGREIYLFDPLYLIEDFEIYGSDPEEITNLIKLQCYGKKVGNEDNIPLEISNTKGMFKIPRDSFNSGTCIYFLCRDGNVVYVGQSENVISRIVDHSKNKLFDDVFYIRVAGNKLDKIESSLIAYLEPEYNKTGQNLTNQRQSIAEVILGVK